VLCTQFGVGHGWAVLMGGAGECDGLVGGRDGVRRDVNVTFFEVAEEFVQVGGLELAAEGLGQNSQVGLEADVVVAFDLHEGVFDGAVEVDFSVCPGGHFGDVAVCHGARRIRRAGVGNFDFLPPGQLEREWLRCRADWGYQDAAVETGHPGADCPRLGVDDSAVDDETGAQGADQHPVRLHHEWTDRVGSYLDEGFARADLLQQTGLRGEHRGDTRRGVQLEPGLVFQGKRLVVAEGCAVLDDTVFLGRRGPGREQRCTGQVGQEYRGAAQVFESRATAPWEPR
jgi:hypothetical protein